MDVFSAPIILEKDVREIGGNHVGFALAFRCAGVLRVVFGRHGLARHQILSRRKAAHQVWHDPVDRVFNVVRYNRRSALDLIAVGPAKVAV